MHTWTIAPYTILLDDDNGRTPVPVCGFVEQTGAWAVHAVRDQYHVTHRPSGRWIGSTAYADQVEPFLMLLEVLNINWQLPDPTYSEHHIATIREYQKLIASRQLRATLIGGSASP